MFVKKMGILVALKHQAEEVPIPGREPLEVLERKAESIVEAFKKFCERLGGRITGQGYTYSCVLPSRAYVKIEARKSPIYGPGNRPERWYVDLEMSAFLETGGRAWFREKSHTVEVVGSDLSIRTLKSQHTEFWSPAFEWTTVEASGVTEIKLSTHPVNNNIEIALRGEKK